MLSWFCPNLLLTDTRFCQTQCKTRTAAHRKAHNREEVEGANESIVLEDLPVDAAACTQATSALGGLFVQPMLAAAAPGTSPAQGHSTETIPAKGNSPEEMSIDHASLNALPSQPPAASKQGVRDCGNSDSDGDSSATPVPKDIPVNQDQTDNMSTDSKISGMSQDSLKKGPAVMILGPTLSCPQGQHSWT